MSAEREIPKERLVHELGESLVQRGLFLATAESCTGGGIARAVTEIAGSSRWFDRAFVTYSDRSKREMLGVSGNTLAAFGAVSEEVVREMVAGALERSDAGLAVAVSGIAGPGGGTDEKPVGTVCFAWAAEGGAVEAETVRFDGDRSSVRKQTVFHALRGLLRMARPAPGA